MPTSRRRTFCIFFIAVVPSHVLQSRYPCYDIVRFVILHLCLPKKHPHPPADPLTFRGNCGIIYPSPQKRREPNGGAHPGCCGRTIPKTRCSYTHRQDASGQMLSPKIFKGDSMDDPDEDTACNALCRLSLYRWNTAYLYALRMHYRYVFLRLNRFMT